MTSLIKDANVTFTAFSSLHFAISFLTRPLTLLNPPKFKDEADFLAFQLSLQSSFFSTYFHESNNPHNLVLSFDLSLLTAPPPPIQLACVESNIQWSDWIRTLGNTPFRLVIRPEQVYIIRGTKLTSIWTAKAVSSSQVADLENSSDSSLEGTDAVESRSSSRSSSFSSFSFASSPTSQSSFSSSEATVEFKSTSNFPHLHAALPNQSTRYMYQGGTSVVLTGGVMLGCPTSRAGTPRSQTIYSKKMPSEALPLCSVARYIPPPMRPRTSAKCGVHNSWRRLV